MESDEVSGNRRFQQVAPALDRGLDDVGGISATVLSENSCGNGIVSSVPGAGGLATPGRMALTTNSWTRICQCRFQRQKARRGDGDRLLSAAFMVRPRMCR